MVRAGVVTHPSQWEAGGYHEIQSEPRRYRIIDRAALAKLLGLTSVASLAEAHAQWVAAALRPPPRGRTPQWTDSLAVGARAFVERVGKELGQGARHRQIDECRRCALLSTQRLRTIRPLGT